MPIKNMTDRGPSFPEIGQLRKGDEKKGNVPGKDLNEIFRFTSKIPEIVDRFNGAYPEATAINVLFPFPSVDQNFDTWMEEWKGGGLVHRCDGEHVVRYQVDGRYVDPPARSLECPYCSGKRERTKKDPGCKQVGRLKVIIPELGQFAYVTAMTTSINDIVEIHGNLEAFEALRGSLVGIPFVLRRVPINISTPGDDGKRVRREKWLWHIDTVQGWVQAQLATMSHHALPGGSSVRLLGSGPTIVDHAPLEDPEFESDDPETPQIEATTAVTPSGSTIDPETGEIDPEDGILDGVIEPDNIPECDPNVVADLRATIDGSVGNIKGGFLADRLVMAGRFANNQMALRALSEWPGLPEGATVSMGKSITKETALKMYDWLTT